MDPNYRATGEQWEWIEDAAAGCSIAGCTAELRARTEALEADSIEQAKSNKFCIDAIVSRIEALEAAQRQVPVPAPKKPPLGCKPRWLMDEERLHDLQAAMKRFEEDGHSVPPEWRAEAREIIERQDQRDEPAPPAPAGGLVDMICRQLPLSPGEARAVIRKVASWLRSELISRAAADRLEEEASR